MADPNASGRSGCSRPLVGAITPTADLDQVAAGVVEHRFAIASATVLVTRVRMSGVLAASVVLVAACGSDATFITGEEYRALTAPMPTDAPGMRNDLSELEQDLASSVVGPDGQRTEVQAAACARLSDLLDEMETGFGRYDLSKEAFRLLRVAYLDCDKAPTTAAEGIQEALSLPPQETSEPPAAG